MEFWDCSPSLAGSHCLLEHLWRQGIGASERAEGEMGRERRPAGGGVKASKGGGRSLSSSVEMPTPICSGSQDLAWDPFTDTAYLGPSHLPAMSRQGETRALRKIEWQYIFLPLLFPPFLSHQKEREREKIESMTTKHFQLH